jgi:membrane-associated protease RseP (regulator of RpoE activity)
VSSQDYPPAPETSSPANGSGRKLEFAPTRRPPRYWLHALLFLAALITTTGVGARLAHNFEANRPAFELDQDLAALADMLAHPALLADGLPFSLTLLVILLAHEMGHYLTCLRYGIDASPPYFIPAPTFIGTFGAFIRIRSPIYSKRVLFDIGLAGPLAGFLFLLPALAIGLAYSKIGPGLADRGDLIFGTPPVLRALEYLILPGVAPADIYLHPVARAAWVGVLATALNLLPIGQLDGGHILYAFVARRHRLLSRVFVGALIPIGIFYWYGWLVWAGFFAFFGLKHPPTIYDPVELDPVRRRLGVLALAILLATFTLAPFHAVE